MTEIWQKSDELQTYVVRCTRHTDVTYCVDAIIRSRHTSFALNRMPRARRNMQDWIKLLDQTPLFKVGYNSTTISLTNYSIEQSEYINDICNYLSKAESFWIFSKSKTMKFDWFDFYGSIDIGTHLIPHDNDDVLVPTTVETDELK